MRVGGFATADEAVRAALERMADDGLEDADEETLKAIEEGVAQSDRGEGIPWETIRPQLRAMVDDARTRE